MSLFIKSLDWLTNQYDKLQSMANRTKIDIESKITDLNDEIDSLKDDLSEKERELKLVNLFIKRFKL